MTPAPTAYEIAAREKKCAALALVIQREAIRVAESLTDAEWREVAKRANVNMPSPSSRERVIEILRGNR